MAKSKKDILKGQLQKGSLKKELPATKEIEAITEQVYKKETTPDKGKEKEAIHRTTFDIPKSLHIAAKIEAMKDGVSLKEFVLTLVKAELEKRGSL